MTLRAGSRNRGFTYPVVLVAIAVMAIGAGTATELTSTIMRRDMEEELIFRGLAYQRAIQSFYWAHPEQPVYPRSIDELLADPRFANRRHLRQAYADPTGGEWRLIRVAGGRIAGVATGSSRAPLRRAHLPPILAKYTDAKRLSEWEFVFFPES